MPATSTARPIAGALTVTAMVAASLMIAGPAFADDEHVHAADIAAHPTGVWPDDDDDYNYLGWHFDQGTGATDVVGGIELGDDENSYLLKGLVETGEPGVAVTPGELHDLITGAVVEGTGTFVLEVPYSLRTLESGNEFVIPSAGSNWGTLQIEITLGDSADGDSVVRSSKNVGSISANTASTLDAVIAELTSVLPPDASIFYSGYGVYASMQEPVAVLASITFGGDTTTFGIPAEDEEGDDESTDDEGDEGDSDEGDEGQTDDSDEGDSDEGDADEGDADEGQTDEGDSDEGDENESGENESGELAEGRIPDLGAQDATPLAITAGALLLLGGTLLFVRRRTNAQRDAR